MSLQGQLSFGESERRHDSLQALKDSLPKLQLPAGDLQLPGLQWPPNLAPAQMSHSLPPLPPVPGQPQLPRPSLEEDRDSPLQVLPGSAEAQALPPNVAQILAEGVEAVEAIEALAPASTQLFAKEVASVLHSMKEIHRQDAASSGASESQPKPSLEGVLSSKDPPVGGAAAVSGLTADSQGSQAAAPSTDQKDAGSQGMAGQLAMLPGPQANPLPSRRAGPAARSQSRRSMRELGLGIVEEEGKVQVIPSCECLYNREILLETSSWGIASDPTLCRVAVYERCLKALSDCRCCQPGRPCNPHGQDQHDAKTSDIAGNVGICESCGPFAEASGGRQGGAGLAAGCTAAVLCAGALVRADHPGRQSLCCAHLQRM